MQRGVLTPDRIVYAANLNDENMQQAMHYLLQEAEDNCQIILSENPVTLTQIDMLIAALSNLHCPSGLHIMLDNCQLTDNHLRKFSDLILRGNYPQGLHLDFSHNMISSMGFFLTLHSLSESGKSAAAGRSITFDFQFNQLDDASIHCLSKHLKRNNFPAGTGFKLQKNDYISEHAIEELTLAFPLNTTVTMLEVDTHDEERAYVADMISDDFPLAALVIPRYQRTFDFCALRNKLFQQYRHDPELRYYLEKLSADAGFPLPEHTTNVPSLQFFSLWALSQSGRLKNLPILEKGFENLRQLAGGIQVTRNAIDPENKDSWCCNIQ